MIVADTNLLVYLYLPGEHTETAVQGREYAVETTRVLDLVRQSTCSAYDCEFVALAKELGAILVTSDTRVLKSFPETAVAPEKFSA